MASEERGGKGKEVSQGGQFGREYQFEEKGNQKGKKKERGKKGSCVRGRGRGNGNFFGIPTVEARRSEY